MLRLRFFGSRRFLPKFARRLPPACASARLLKARCKEASRLDGSGETRGRQALWITMDDVYREFGRRSALLVPDGLPMPEGARRRPQARSQKPLLSGAAAYEDPRKVASRRHCRGFAAATGMLRRRRRDGADFRSCASEAERRRLTRSAKIGSYVSDNLMLTAEQQAKARKHESVRYGASGLSDRQDR